LDSSRQMTHSAPAEQPSSVRQVAERLFPAYTVDDGKARLAGCLLEDRLFVRAEFRHGEESGEVYVDGDSRQVDPDLVDALGMRQLAELEKPTQPFEPAVERLIEAAGKIAADRFSSGDPPELVDATAVWCKFVEGKLRFSVGESSADLAFSGWARTLEPPPFVCSQTATSTFHLAATDDGRIAAAEQIERCEESGQRVLADDLATCSVSGRRVLADLLHSCPVSEGRLLKEEMVECRSCCQRVSPAAIQRGQCAACRQVRPVSKDDPRMARLLDEHPLLDRWGNWRISETADCYVLTAAGWFKRMLAVVDKESLELRHLAVGSRLFGTLATVEPSQYDYVLRH